MKMKDSTALDCKHLSQTELEELKAFIQKRGFKEVDLQYEILDHLACQVENIMDLELLSFEEAVIKAHAGYGVMGFSVIEDSVKQALSRQYRQQMHAEWKLWSDFPRILLVFGFGAFFYKLSSRFTDDWMFFALTFLYLLAQGGILYTFRSELRAYRNTLISKSSLAYIVVFPTVGLQLLIRVPDLLQAFLPTWKPFLFPFIFAVFSLTLAFLVASSYRIVKYSMKRCELFESQYGPL